MIGYNYFFFIKCKESNNQLFLEKDVDMKLFEDNEKENDKNDGNN